MRRHTLDEIRACKKGTEFGQTISRKLDHVVCGMIRLHSRRIYRLRDAQEVEDWLPGKLQRMLRENLIVPDGKGGYYFRHGGDKNELKKLGKALLIFFMVRSGYMSIDPTKNDKEELKALIRNLIQYFKDFTSQDIEAWKVVRNRPLALSVVYPEELKPAEGTHVFPEHKYHQLKAALEEQDLYPQPDPQEEEDADEESDDEEEEDESDGEGEGVEEEQAVVLGAFTHMHTDDDHNILSDGHTDTDTLSEATMSPGGCYLSADDTLIDASMFVESLKDLEWLDMYMPVEGGWKREREHCDGDEGGRCDNKRVKLCVDASHVNIIKHEHPVPSRFNITSKFEWSLSLNSSPPTTAPTATYTLFMLKPPCTCEGSSTKACIDTAPHTHTALPLCLLLTKKEEVTTVLKEEQYDVKGCMGGSSCVEPADMKACADDMLCDERLWDEEEEEEVFHPLEVEALAMMFPELVGQGAWFDYSTSTSCASS